MAKSRILVTGATGFIGASLISQLQMDDRFDVVGSVRLSNTSSADGVRFASVGNINGRTDWSAAVKDVDVVIHTAARVHVMHDLAEDPLHAFRLVNVCGTRRLAEAAAAAGVSRFVFLSSIKVNGEKTGSDAGLSPAFHADDAPSPSDAYGQSKLEAEEALTEIAISSGLGVVIVRPPLVYGPGARGNFPRLARLVESGVPLPLASVCNKRSLIGLDNLVDCLMRCATHPAAPGNTFLVSDGHDLSTPELIEQIAAALGRSSRLWPFPTSILKLAGRLSGQAVAVQRLTESLQVDIEPTMRVLEWRPPLDVEAGIRRAVTTQ